jgi:hypothetical protein
VIQAGGLFPHLDSSFQSESDAAAEFLGAANTEAEQTRASRAVATRLDQDPCAAAKSSRIWFTRPVTHTAASPAKPASMRSRISAFDWSAIQEALDRDGYARLPCLLNASECEGLRELYSRRERFRSFIDMGAKRYGEGSYRYFTYPLPALVRSLRSQLYAKLAPVANDWSESLTDTRPYPMSLKTFIEECHGAGQLRPTPLLLHYETGGFNCMHQDVYGRIAFPLQVACLLSPSRLDPTSTFMGGEFLLSEQRPRQQSRVTALTLSEGEGLIFANQFRPATGNRGVYRAVVKHGISPVEAGERYTLGVIFHDAE